jgi:hypothetical protein
MAARADSNSQGSTSTRVPLSCSEIELVLLGHNCAGRAGASGVLGPEAWRQVLRFVRVCFSGLNDPDLTLNRLFFAVMSPLLTILRWVAYNLEAGGCGLGVYGQR